MSDTDYHRRTADGPGKTSLSALQRLAMAERLIGENWSDEDIERLAGVTLRQILALRAEHAASVAGPRG